MKILLTGFEAFGPHKINPTEEMLPKIVEALDSDFSHEVVAEVLPVCHEKAPSLLLSLIKKLRPDLIVSLGVDGKRDKICLETRAVNLLDFKISDNSGVQINGEPIIAGDQPERYVKRDLSKLLGTLPVQTHPCMLSDDAGAFICNQIFYHSLAWARDSNQEAFFIHVPTDSIMQQDLKVELVKAFILRVTA